MATTLLELVKGDPAGKSAVDEYQFEQITIDGDLEQSILAEMANYQLKCTTEYWIDHDEYGKYLDDTTVIYYPLDDVVERCFVYDGHFAGVMFTTNIHFVQGGAVLGGAKNYHSWWVNSRRMDNSISQYQLVKKQ